MVFISLSKLFTFHSVLKKHILSIQNNLKTITESRIMTMLDMKIKTKHDMKMSPLTERFASREHGQLPAQGYQGTS